MRDTAHAMMWFAAGMAQQDNWRAARWFGMCSTNAFTLGQTRVASLPARWFEQNLGKPA